MPLLAITIDRLPAWILPAYGTAWVAAPRIDGLAARGLVLDGLVATSDDPRDAAHGILGRLGAVGGRTAVVTDDESVAAAAGPDGAVELVPPEEPPRQAPDEERTGFGRLVAAAAAVIARRSHDVVWCHASCLGRSWDAPEPLRSAYLDPEDPPPPVGAAVPSVMVTAATDPDLVTGLRHVFAGQVTLLDRVLGTLLDAAGTGCGVLFAGLRGMPLGLHGLLGPGTLPPYAELVRLPAIIVDPSGRMAGQRFDGLVTPADVGATLADLSAGAAAGGPGPDADRGRPESARSLAALWSDWTVGEVRDRVIVRGSGGVAVVTKAWHLVRTADAGGGTTSTRLFVKPDDAFDLCDVADRCPDVVESLGPLAEAAARGDLAAAWEGPLGAGARPAD